MPVTLMLLPVRNATNSMNSATKVIKAITEIPSIALQGVEYTINRSLAGIVQKVTMILQGIAILEVESSHMFLSIIADRLLETNLPYYAYSISIPHNLIPGEAVFRHQKFRPLKTKNARNISEIKDVVIPEKFSCPLSGDIMNEPVYDIRSPHIVYDHDFLIYWLNKSPKPKLMPHTRLLFAPSYLKNNYLLKLEITKFMKSATEAHNQKILNQALDQFILKRLKNKQDSLNQALRRAAGYGDTNDIKILLKAGAKINAKDSNPQKQNTALHVALKLHKVDNAALLISHGAEVNIPNAQQVTAFEMIHMLSGEYPSILKNVCRVFKVNTTPRRNVLSSTNGIALLPSSRNAAAELKELKNSRVKEAKEQIPLKKARNSQQAPPAQRLIRRNLKDSTPTDPYGPGAMAEYKAPESIAGSSSSNRKAKKTEIETNENKVDDSLTPLIATNHSRQSSISSEGSNSSSQSSIFSEDELIASQETRVGNNVNAPLVEEKSELHRMEQSERMPRPLFNTEDKHLLVTGVGMTLIGGGLWLAFSLGALSPATLCASAAVVTLLAIAWPAAIALTVLGASLIVGVGIYKSLNQCRQDTSGVCGELLIQNKNQVVT